MNRVAIPLRDATVALCNRISILLFCYSFYKLSMYAHIVGPFDLLCPPPTAQCNLWTGGLTDLFPWTMLRMV